MVKSEKRIGVVVAELATNGLSLARDARQLQPRIGVVYTSAVPHALPQEGRVKDAPVLRSPYTPHQLAAVISGLGRRVLEEEGAAA
jgi:hypothetical protein